MKVSLRVPNLYLFHKPPGLVVSHSDPLHPRTVYDAVAHIVGPPEHTAAVGRLDIASEGLLLLSDDRRFASFLAQPSAFADPLLRVYDILARARGDFPFGRIQRFVQGGCVVDGVRYAPILAESLRRGPRSAPDSARTTQWMRWSLSEGKNREIRRILARFRVDVLKLRRIRFGPFSLGRLAPGQVKPVPIPTWMLKQYAASLHQSPIDSF